MAATTAACPDVRQWVRISQQGSQIEVSGKLPAACDGSQAYVNVLEQNDFAAQSFAALWAELGGSGPQGMALGSAPANARTLAQYQSEPLTVALNDINKYSNNTMARTVYLTLGREDGSSGDTPADAQHAVRRLLAEQHISDEALVLENGCGLSRRERVSARLLGQVLLNAARGPMATN
jgi:D-alanyl-D-alanine carboxypeptidase/D-alanyl-D-alanine-endopeptidase (penicillin-binding protein 4)